jgi:hypothetical protein
MEEASALWRLCINLVLIDQREQAANLRRSPLYHHQEPWVSGRSEKGYQFLLKGRAQVDQHIATTEQIDTGERWVDHEIMPGKDA